MTTLGATEHVDPLVHLFEEFDDPVGLNHSSLTNTSAAPSGTTLCNCTTGVCPTTSVIDLPTLMVTSISSAIAAAPDRQLHDGRVLHP